MSSQSPTKCVFSWSSGKDSALALYYLLQNPSISVEHLIITVNKDFDRVTMHGTPISLVERQLNALQIPYSFIELPENPTMNQYEDLFNLKLIALKEDGIEHIAFGDIFLEDLKAYRISQMTKIGFQTIFPLWQKNTTQLLQEFLVLGFRAIIVSANDQLGRNYLGRELDGSFLKDLAENIDPCGENGEFHTFCFDGPIFKQPVGFTKGEIVRRTYPNPAGEGESCFWFQDLVS